MIERKIMETYQRFFCVCPSASGQYVKSRE